MPERFKRQPIALQLLDQNTGELPPVNEQGFWGNLSDSYAIGFWGALKDGADRIVARTRGVNRSDYDPLNHIPTGYEQYAEDYALAYNQSEVDAITRNIDENNVIRARRQELFAGGLVYDLISGVFDPVNLVGVGMKGLTIKQAAAKGAAVYGGINAGQELVRNALDPTTTDQETALNVGFGFVVAGILSGAGSYFSKSHRGTIDLEPEVRIKAEQAGDQFGVAAMAAEGRPVTDVIDFNGQGVKIVDGPTGKVDAAGNPVAAFFRSKSVFEAEQAAARVSAAADTALGDVIPDVAPIRTMEEGAPLVDEAMPDAPVEVIDREMVDALGFDTGSRAAASDGTEAFQAASKAAPAEDPEDTIFIDSEAILARYEDKPWMQPRVDGVEPLPEDAFKSPEEWLNFVVLHELNHKTTKRAAGQSKAEYENFINKLAYDEVKAGRLPLSPTDSALEKLMLLPTPSGTLMRLAPRNREVHGLAQGIAGDHSTLTIANRMGQATTPGGSVFQRAQQWMVSNYVMAVAWQRSYVQYVTGKAADTAAGNAREAFRLSLPVIGTRARGGKLSPAEFRDYVGRAIYDDQPFEMHGRPLDEADMKLVRAAAEEGRKLFAQFEAKARSLGMFDAKRRIERDIAWREKALDRNQTRLIELNGKLEELARREKLAGRPLTPNEKTDLLAREMADVADMEAKARARGEPEYDPGFLPDGTPRKRARMETRAHGLAKRLVPWLEERNINLIKELDELRLQSDNLLNEPIKLLKDENYFPRIFDVGKIRERYDDFVKLVTEAYGGDEAALGRAKQTADRIIGEGGVDEFVPGSGGPKNLLSREIPLTNRELSDFIVHDVETVMGLYSRRMSASIEMVNKYGSRLLDEQLDDLRVKLIDQGFDDETIRKITEEMEDMRDRVLGRFHGKDPMSWDNRVARGIKNFGTLTLMGKSVLSQTMDIARTIATEGYKPLFQAMHTAFRNGTGSLAAGRYAKQAGEALEMVNADWMARLIDSDSALTVTQQSALERGLAAAQSPFFKLNLMNPFTVVWKDFTSIMSGHMLIDEAETIAKAVRAGRSMETFTKAERKIAANLASWGIDLRSAQLIADQPFERTEGSGLILANIENWSGRDGERAREVFLGAVSGTIRSSVVTPGPLQRAAIMDGVFRWKGERVEAPLASLPFQLMSFTMSSSAKLTHALLSGRDRKVAASLSALMVGGMVTTYLKAQVNGTWDYMEWDDFALQSFENSSVLGWLGDVYKRVESMTGYGPRAAMGLENFSGNVSDQIGAALGPAPGVLSGLVEAFVSDDMEDRDRARLIRRAVPMSGLIWWDSTLKEWTKNAADAGWLPLPDGDQPSYTGLDEGELLQDSPDEPAEVLVQ